jgi:hypothetical protein
MCRSNRCSEMPLQAKTISYTMRSGAFDGWSCLFADVVCLLGEGRSLRFLTLWVDSRKVLPTGLRWGWMDYDCYLNIKRDCLWGVCGATSRDGFKGRHPTSASAEV